MTTNLIKQVAGGFELIVLAGSTCGPQGLHRHQIVIDFQGKITTLRTKLYMKGDPDCNS